MALIKSKQIQAIASQKVTLEAGKQFLTDAQISAWNAKYDAVLVEGGVDGIDGANDGLMRGADKFKLDGVAVGANNYTHDPTHPASMIDQSTTLQFASQAEKDSWADKYTQAETDNLLSSMQTGLEWKASVATKDGVGGLVDTYPDAVEGYVVSVDDEGGQTYRYDDINGWEKFLSMVYNTAVASTSFGADDGQTGLMTGDDKFKLDTVAVNANDYVHPTNHLPAVITQDADNRFVTDLEKDAWNAKAETTEATINDKGLMPAADKEKLDKGVNYQKDLVLNISTNAQTSIPTGVGLNVDTLSHRTNVANGEVFVNGFKQTPNSDYTISVDGSSELVIDWEASADFDLETNDVLVFNFTKMV